MPATDPHRIGELRSIAYHRELAEKLAVDLTVLERARERARGWLVSGEVARPYAEAWVNLLDLPRAELRAALVDGSERMTTLRSCSPFAGALDPRTRWRLFRDVKREASR